MPVRKAQARVVSCAAESNGAVFTGENKRQNEGGLLQEETLQTRKSQHRDNEGCPCPRVECDTQSRGLASHSPCPLCSPVPESPRKGRTEGARLAPLWWGWSTRSGLCPLSFPGKENLARSPLGTSPGHRDWSHSAQRPQVTYPSCQPMLNQPNVLADPRAARRSPR